MYVGFWRRFAAHVIDHIVLTVIIVIFLLFWALFEFILNTLGVEEGAKEMILGAIGLPLLIIIQWLYYALFESSSKQGTLGKMALNIVVVDKNHSKISFKRATGRFFSKIISAFLFIGFFIMLFTRDKQALHDLIMNTYVVKKGD